MIEIFKSLFSKKGNTKMEELITEGAFLVDVRSSAEFADGNVKNSVNIPVDQIAKFKNKKHIVVFCRSGMRSIMAKATLERNGSSNVTNGGTWNNINAVVNK
jgi:phage shock protein E